MDKLDAFLAADTIQETLNSHMIFLQKIELTANNYFVIKSYTVTDSLSFSDITLPCDFVDIAC